VAVLTGLELSRITRYPSCLQSPSKHRSNTQAQATGAGRQCQLTAKRCRHLPEGLAGLCAGVVELTSLQGQYRTSATVLGRRSGPAAVLAYLANHNRASPNDHDRLDVAPLFDFVHGRLPW
jgi:hypothetical protein